jgi:alkylation response protein AidB-like acyl-CoA dehydrogenase
MTRPSTTEEWVTLARELGTLLQPQVNDHDHDGELSVEAFRLLRESGLTAALVPAEFGGGDARHLDMGAVLRELARYDSSTAVALSMHSHVVAFQLWRHRRGMDASGVLTKVANGTMLLSTGASDWLGSNGTTRRVDGGYRVTARKAPISGCEVGNVLSTSFRFDDAPDGPSVIHCSVPIDAPGVRIERTWDTLGLRATGSHTVVFDDVFLPDAAVALVRPADVWAPVWNAILGCAMPLIMSAYLGIADAAVDAALRSVSGRSDSHVVLGAGQMIGAHLRAVDAVTAMFAEADDLRFDNTDARVARVLARKSTAADAVIETVRLALEVSGGSGYSRTSPIQRHLRDVHGCLFHPLPAAKQVTLTGRVALGLSPVDECAVRGARGPA